MRCIVLFFLFCPMASVQLFYIGAGNPISKGSRSHMFYVFNAVTCLAAGPFSGSWLPPEVPSGEQQLSALPVSTRSRWRQGALHTQPQILQRTARWDGCGPFLSEGLRCITWNTRGLVGSVFSRQRNREFKLKYLKRLLDNNHNMICLQEVHGKDEFFQAIQVLAPRFRLFGSFLLDNENTRENLEAREAEVSTLPWTQTEKVIALARYRSGQRTWRNKKPVLSLSAVTDEEGHSLDNEDDSGRRLCEYWGAIFQARDEGPRHHQHEDILRFVQHPPDDIRWTIDKTEFDDLLALKKDSAPGPGGIPYGVYRCAGGLGSKFFFHAYQAVLEGSTIPDCFAESRTIFIPKTSDIDDFGRIIRSPDALRPFTLCNCDCKLLTSAICRGLHWYMHLFQAGDGQHL